MTVSRYTMRESTLKGMGMMHEHAVLPGLRQRNPLGLRRFPRTGRSIICAHPVPGLSGHRTSLSLKGSSLQSPLSRCLVTS